MDLLVCTGPDELRLTMHDSLEYYTGSPSCFKRKENWGLAHSTTPPRPRVFGVKLIRFSDNPSVRVSSGFEKTGGQNAPVIRSRAAA
jgi:hypothetical protein